MKYHLTVNAIASSVISSTYAFESLSEALELADTSIKLGYLQRGDLVTTFGPGSLLSVMSEEAMTRAAEGERKAQQSGGLVQSARFSVKDGQHILHIQCGMASFPPLTFASRAALDVAVMDALRDRFVRYEVEAEHDYLFGVIGPHVALLALTSEKYLEQRRAAIAQQMRTQARSAPRIISGR